MPVCGLWLLHGGRVCHIEDMRRLGMMKTDDTLVSGI